MYLRVPTYYVRPRLAPPAPIPGPARDDDAPVAAEPPQSSSPHASICPIPRGTLPPLTLKDFYSVEGRSRDYCNLIVIVIVIMSRQFVVFLYFKEGKFISSKWDLDHRFTIQPTQIGFPTFIYEHWITSLSIVSLNQGEWHIISELPWFCWLSYRYRVISFMQVFCTTSLSSWVSTREKDTLSVSPPGWKWSMLNRHQYQYMKEDHVIMHLSTLFVFVSPPFFISNQGKSLLSRELPCFDKFIGTQHSTHM